MSPYLVGAAVLSILLGVVHSVLGERMIFSPLKKEKGQTTLRKNRGILWATWHLVTVFGFVLGIVLLEKAGFQLPIQVVPVIAVSTFGGAVLVLWGTKGRHPGWIVLAAIAVLCCLSLLM